MLFSLLYYAILVFKVPYSYSIIIYIFPFSIKDSWKEITVGEFM